MDLSNPSWIRGFHSKANVYSFFPFRKQRVCFLIAFTTSIGIRALIYPSLIADKCVDDHPINNKIEDLVFTKAEFQQFREEN